MLQVPQHPDGEDYIPEAWPEGVDAIILPSGLSPENQPAYGEDAVALKKILQRAGFCVTWAQEEGPHAEVLPHGAEWIVPTLLWFADPVAKGAIETFIGALVERIHLRNLSRVHLQIKFRRDGRIKCVDYRGDSDKLATELLAAIKDAIGER